ncbi:TetR/AcrR family transcriptional regulator [Fusobacterium canifelinum]|uniref:TetR/AcrR family transcriptional regulator n=1 Tax=Fusobacterium canifelinum TaxID=285729 RepID=A0A7T9LD62_9FUSO|nr:TetR/AcrR family transcriptional regulator [Fusobacterium canifelinum]QQB73172.1 TetR/AcrR family transcriptional regulator [Fusobacterium canifelinum]QQS86685.1 TetR/AcrR family transcriptional regulator [Fusobacterium canifelinum]
MERNYHHGNLKEELIKKGIELISEVGEENLSLRKLAIICGVSNAAPYTHFKSKDELLKEMSLYILNLLKLELENTRKKYKNKDGLLVMLGKTYVIFFLKNPKYYYFLSSRKDIEIDLSLKIDNNNMTALDILKEEAINKFSKFTILDEDIQNKILAMWSLVAGLVAIINMTSKNYIENWEDKIEEIIKASFITYYTKY